MPKTITLTLEGIDSADIVGFKECHKNSYNILTRKILELLPVPDQELRLIVLRGEYLPNNKVRYLEVDNITGKISGRECSGGSIIAYYNCSLTEGKSFAPPELAEELSKVIQGKYRPTKEDIKNKVPFWRHCSELDEGTYGKVAVQSASAINGDYNSDFKYFFTSSQKATFIASIEKAKGEEKLFHFTAEEYRAEMMKTFEVAKEALISSTEKWIKFIKSN